MCDMIGEFLGSVVTCTKMAAIHKYDAVRCVQLKYLPWTASKEQVIARNEADTQISPTGKNTGIEKGIMASNLPPCLRIPQDPKQSCAVIQYKLYLHLHLHIQ